jgi:23S rRNA (uridine2552-2'-O)-methyltransferase
MQHLRAHRRLLASRSGSSTQWLQRQRADEYVLKAAREGYRSRAAYKLLQMNAKNRPPLLQPRHVALDLGAAPGSWMQVMANHEMEVVGVDLLPCSPIDGTAFVQGDFTDEDIQEQLLKALAGRADLVVSDVSPDRSGNKILDSARITDLAEEAIALSRRCLKPGGSFVCKLLQGADLNPLLARCKPLFAKGSMVKPPASRQKSKEVYFIGRGWKPKAYDQFWLNDGL